METFTRRKVKDYFKWKKTMSNTEIKNFIMFYERLTKHMLKNFSKKSDCVITIDNKHRLKSLRFN